MTRRAGKSPRLNRPISTSSPEVTTDAYNKALARLQKQHAAGYSHSDVLTTGEEVLGNVQDQTKVVRFREADVAQLVPHDFGYVIRNWTVVDKDAKCDIWRDTEKTETARGLWLACDVADVTARIRMDGQRS